MTVTETDPRVRALVQLIAAWRPEWNDAGIRSGLGRARKPGRTLEALERVALDAARDPAALTPATFDHQSRWEEIRRAKTTKASYIPPPFEPYPTGVPPNAEYLATRERMRADAGLKRQ